jgi:death on curing protein
MAVRFIPDEIVLLVHADLIRRYGGQTGIRDRGLLSSALVQPQMTGGGKFLHKTIFDKTAAYGFHVCRNHPFVDGNKRVAFVLMDIFLRRNGYELAACEDEAYVIMMALADGRLTKLQLTAWLKDKSKPINRKAGRPGSQEA